MITLNEATQEKEDTFPSATPYSKPGSFLNSCSSHIESNSFLYSLAQSLIILINIP